MGAHGRRRGLGKGCGLESVGSGKSQGVEGQTTSKLSGARAADVSYQYRSLTVQAARLVRSLQAKNGDKGALGDFRDVTHMVESCNGFAEVFPEHKYEIVAILQVWKARKRVGGGEARRTGRGGMAKPCGGG